MHGRADAEAKRRIGAHTAAQLVANDMAVRHWLDRRPPVDGAGRARPADRCIAGSPATERARALDLEVEPFERLDRLDIAIDSADQIAPDGWLVKGGGGAHTREA